eukprot:s562_g3.t1
MRSVSELKAWEYVQGKEADQKVIQLTAYLTSVVENSDSLAADSSYWQQLADIIATADCLQHVHRVRLVKISEQVTGLVADIHLNQAIISAGRFLPESELYYATLWSRKKGFSARDVMDIRAHELMFHATEEWALRLLSHGRPVSVIPTRSVAESVITSQILSVIRKKHYDIDVAAEAIWRHVHPGKEPPSKTNELTQLFQPLVDMMIRSVDSFAPIQQGAAASQNLIKLETELDKRKQQLRQQGVLLTPEKSGATVPDSATSSGHKPGQSWCKTLKKTMGAGKYAELEELVGEITAQIEDTNNKLTKDKSRELAIKFGLPLSIVNKMGVKSLRSVVALASVLAA